MQAESRPTPLENPTHTFAALNYKKARVTRDSAIIARWPSAAILDIINPQIAPFDPPTPKTLT